MKRFLFSRPVGNSIRGIILLSMLLMSFGYGGAHVAYAAPPVHDDFNAAKIIGGIEYHDVDVNTTEATPSNTVANVDDPDQIPCPEPGNPGKVLDYGFATVWYKYTPPENQAISLNTIGSDYDTFVAVWTGSRGNLTLVPGTCNDDTFEGQTSETGFIGTAGTTYYIEVAQYNDGTGGTTNIGGILKFNAYITNTRVKVGGIVRASYFVPESGGLRRNLINLNAGPVEMYNVANNQFIAGGRVIYSAKGKLTSFTEMMGLPNNQLYRIYRLPWYTNNSTMDTQLRIANVSTTTATIRIFIGGKLMAGSPFTVARGASVFRAFPGVDRGPVRIVSNVNIVVSKRMIYKVNTVPASLTEVMGLPENRLDKVYWLPWYDNKAMTTQLQISNASAFTATIRVFIGGRRMAGSPFTLAPGKTRRLSYPGINRGLVKIVSNVKILASERVFYKVNTVPVSFTEMMALPHSQLDTIYWLPWYTKTQTINTQLQIANASGSPATVHVYINGTEMAGSPFPLAVGAAARKTFPGIDKGLVKITSNVRIVASARVVYLVNGQATSYSEIMALPNKLLDSRYWMPWYNNTNMNTQLRFALP